jgi:hypothetical protein
VITRLRRELRRRCNEPEIRPTHNNQRKRRGLNVSTSLRRFMSTLEPLRAVLGCCPLIEAHFLHSVGYALETGKHRCRDHRHILERQ